MLEYVGCALDVIAVLGRLVIVAWGFVVGKELVYVGVTAESPLFVPGLILPEPVLLAGAPVTMVLGVNVVDPGELVPVFSISIVTKVG